TNLVGDKATGWRHFELVTTVKLDPARGRSKIWLPAPTHVWLDHQRPVDNKWKGNYSRVGMFREPVYGCEAVYAHWAQPDTKAPMQIELISTVSVRDRASDLGKPQAVTKASPDEVALYSKGTPSSPTDGIVLETARKIAKPDQTSIEKAQAVYDWILENGVR